MSFFHRSACARWFLLATLATGGGACKPKPGFDEQAPGPSATKKSGAPTVLTGTIRLAGSELPKYRPEDMERRVLAHIQGGTFPEICTPPKLVDRTPVRQTADGRLIGVMVAASEFSKAITREPKTWEVTIKDCRLTPSLVVGMVGDSLILRSEVNYPLMPTYGANAYNETLVAGQSKTLRLDKPGVDNVLCGFTAPCGRTDVVVLHHPVYAVTAEDGAFRIENFPADETIKVNAWHPLFQDASQSVKVGRGETKKIEFVLTPLPPQPETPVPAGSTEETGKATK